MIKKVAAYMEAHHMVQAGDHVCAGISGGADSVALLLILKELCGVMQFSLSAIHVEHGIRAEESLADMRFVKRLCGQYGIPLTCRSFPVPELAKSQGLSEEEAGRNVRYEAFSEEERRYAAGAKSRGGTVKTAVAHHGDDNAETVLFHLCRGSGIEGIAGIRPVRGNIIRPFLGVTRREIEDFLEERGQEYRTDTTNADTGYSRNRIRSCIMPQLALVNEASTAHINLLAEDMLEISAYLQEETDKILKAYMKKREDGTVCFAAAGLAECPPFLKKRVILELIARVSGSRKDITREHASSVLGLLYGQTGRRLSLPYGITAEASYGSLLLSQRKNSEKKECLIRLPLEGSEGEIRLDNGILRYRILENQKKDRKIPQNLYTKWFDYDKIKNRLYIRNREPGDYFVLDLQGHRQKLRDYWMNERVPRDLRDRIPLLADGSHILWAVGYRISSYYKITEHTKRVLEVHFMEERA